MLQLSRICKTCSKEFPLTSEHFHAHPRYSGGFKPHCIKCANTRAKAQVDKPNRNKWTRNRRQENKLKAIEYKGGKCAHCGGVFHPAAFDFHHLDPTKKDMNPTMALASSFEYAKRELDKCVLLCSNCHRIEHHTSN